MSVNEKMTAIADAIRGHTTITKKLSLDEMPSGINEVYNDGYNVGYTLGGQAEYGRGKAEGIEEGKQAEHNEFMENYLTSFHAGQGTDMHWFFAGSGWNDKTFYPTRDLKPRNAYQMFRYNLITDIWGRMAELGWTLDFSGTTTLYQTFWGYKGTWHGVIDMRKATATNDSCFRNNENLVEIKKLIISEDTSLHNNMFIGCAELISMPIEGTIGKNGFDVSDCVKLNKASIESIINALSATKSGLTVTLSKAAVNAAFGIDIDDVSTYPEGSEYYTLRQSKRNWTINYS